MAQAASSITGSPCARAQRQDPGEVAGHADLVDAQDRLGPRRDRRRDAGRVQVEGGRVDVDEHRDGTALADDVGRGDEAVADGDHFVAGPDSGREQRQMQRGGAVRDRAGVRVPRPRPRTRPRTRRPRPPATASRSRPRRPPRPPPPSPSQGRAIGIMPPARPATAVPARLARHQRDELAQPLLERYRRHEAEQLARRPSVPASRRGTGLTARSGRVLGHEIGPVHRRGEEFGQLAAGWSRCRCRR